MFDFGLIDGTGIGLLGLSDETKFDAFAELLYYSHVIGDFQDKIRENLKAEKYTMDLKLLPFATEGAGNDNRDFFWDLGESLRTIASGTEAQGNYEKRLAPGGVSGPAPYRMASIFRHMAEAGGLCERLQQKCRCVPPSRWRWR